MTHRTNARRPKSRERTSHTSAHPRANSPFASSFEYQGRQFWEALTPRERSRLTTAVRRWQRLERATLHAYELGRLDDAELLDAEAARAAAALEFFLDEIESESGAEDDAESDLLAELASLYEYHFGNQSPYRQSSNAEGVANRAELAHTARSIIESWAGGQSVHATDQEVYEATQDAWTRVRKLRRPVRDAVTRSHYVAHRNVLTVVLERARATRTNVRQAGARYLLQRLQIARTAR